MLSKTIIIISTVATVLLFLILQSTTPTNAGPLGILAVFFLLYVALTGIITGILHGGSTLLAKIIARFTVKKPLQAMSALRAYYFASILALAPVMLLAMGSVNQPGVYDIMLVVAFVAIGVFYVQKRM